MSQFLSTTPASLTVREGRDRYLAANGFTLEEYEAPSFRFDLFGVLVTFPNIEANRRSIPFHDLHHVLTGYGTDLTGEMEIAAWELSAGCADWFQRTANGLTTLLGLALSPRRTLRAFRRGFGQKTLYGDPEPYESLLACTVGELRRRLGISKEGLADRPAPLHRRAPAAPKRRESAPAA